MSTRNKYITIINRNYPPSLAVIGESICDLAEYLERKHNIKSIIVHVDCIYDGGGKERKPVGEIYKIPAFYNGKNTILRLIGSLIEGFFLVKQATKVRKGIVVSMTNPPLLNFWSARMFPKKSIPWALWTMDVYPENFVSANLISSKNPIYKYISRVLKKNAPDKIITLGPNQTKFIEDKYQQSYDSTILPCGVFMYHSQGDKPAWRKDDSKIYFGYCGNLGEAHSLEFVKELIEQLDPHRHKFILSVYGKKSKQLIEQVGHKEVVESVSHVSRAQLNFIDIHLVSLLPNYTHICVPSKAVSAVSTGASFLFYGNKESDNWSLLGEAGWLIEENRDLKTQIATFINDLDIATLQQKKTKASHVSANLRKLLTTSYDQIAELANAYN